jgi:mannosyltransferase OCH1-like enzyme
MIPKLIHSTGPTDKSKWHPVWNHCIKSWKEQFPERDYFHFNWTDEELEELVRDDYPQYWDLYQSFPFHIMKIDFAEYCLLHKYGGIYHDLDMYCYQNFYEDIKNQDFVLLESCMHDEFIQNCMMVSKVGDPFWIDLMDEIKRTFYNYPDTPDVKEGKALAQDFYIKDTTACYMLTRFTLRYSNRPVAILPKDQYNPLCNTYCSSHKTKHMLTNTWGKDYIDANIENMGTWEPGRFKDLQDWFKQNYVSRSDIDKDALGETA